VLVTFGGTIHAKRTALAYILFNAVAGAIAIALLPAFLSVIAWLGKHAGLDAGATSLAAFHTLFIAVGVLLFLPFVPQFARLVERVLPDRGEDTTQRLDASLLSIPAVALEASQRALEHAALGLLDVYGEMLSGTATDTHAARLQQTTPSLNDIYDFISRIELPAGDPRAAAQRIAQLHAIDHLLRFRARLHELAQANVDLTEPGYRWALENSRQILQSARQGLEQQDLQASMEPLKANATTLSALSHDVRHAIMKETVSGSSRAPHVVLQRTDSFRWLARTGNHIWRICHYLSQGRAPEKVAPAAVAPIDPPQASEAIDP